MAVSDGGTGWPTACAAHFVIGTLGLAEGCRNIRSLYRNRAGQQGGNMWVGALTKKRSQC